MNFSLAEQLMYSTVKISMLDHNKLKIGSASSFIFSFTHKDKFFPTLVTNKHVTQGCNFINIRFTSANENFEPLHGKISSVLIDTNFSICHPSADLAMFPIGHYFNLAKSSGDMCFFKSINESLIPSPPEWNSLDIADEVIMIGYPRGQWDEKNNLPIFRRGITATHPSFDFNGEKCFLVDMACFPGSSGSPVFLYNQGSYYDKNTNSLNIGSRIKLLGIQNAIPNIKEFGQMVNIQSNEQSVPVVQSYMNLGYIIKSTELLELKQLFIQNMVSNITP